jgi:multidrug efflux system outer membrane protein
MNNPSMNHTEIYRGVLRPLSLAVMLFIAGCAGLPPADQAPNLHAPQVVDFSPGNDGRWPVASWWTEFNDPQLEALVNQALRNSPSMAVVQARIEQANSEVREVSANAGANVSADASVTRERYSANSYYPPPIAGSTLNSGSLALNFSYDVDWWGRNRNLLAAALGRSAASKAEAAGAAASLSAEVANTYFQWQTLNGRIQLQDQIEAQRSRLVELEAHRVKTGISAGDNLTPLQADAAAPHQTKVQLETQRDQLYYQLKSLVGSDHFPETLHAQSLPAANGGLPANLPLDLLARRPDVTASRERVQASLHDVDAARAAFYPDLNLSAFIGFTSLSLGTLLHGDSRTQGFTPALHLPIFDAGRLRANLDSNRADVELAVAQYDQSVQTAVSEVNDAAIKLKGAQREQASLSTQLTARTRDLDSAQRRVKSGLADGRELARDKLSLLSLNDQELIRQQHALSAQIELIKALGGGYRDQSQDQATDTLSKK